MKILAIDQSYTCSGVIVFEDGEIKHAELIKTKKAPKGESDELEVFHRAYAVTEKLSKVAKDHNVDLVAIEGLAFGMRGNATRDLAGLQFAVVIQLLKRDNIPVAIYSPLTIKKFATGDGKAKKIELLENTPEHTVEFFKTELNAKKTTGLLDLIDAYWIGKLAFDRINEEK